MKQEIYIGIAAFILIIIFIFIAIFNRKNPNNSTTPTTTSPFVSSTSGIPESNSSPSSTMEIASAAFENNGSIPSKYTCDAAAPVSPPLFFSNIPSGTKSLALVVDDHDVPKQLLPTGVFDHWVVFNMPPDTTGISENTSTGILGLNGAGKAAYAPPCPPPQYSPAEHRYIFTLYALDTTLPLSAGATKQQVLDAMQGHIIDQTQLIGKYQKMSSSTQQ